MENPNIFIAFLAGVLSIASPCILPIIPSFIGYITGVSLSTPYQGLSPKELRLKLLLNTISFAVGFSLIFLLFGAVIGLIGETLVLNRPIFQKIGGVIIILFGLQLTGIFQFKALVKEKRFELPEGFKKLSYNAERSECAYKPSGFCEAKHLIRSFFTGIFFAFGWAPCYGPIVGAIFTLAAAQASFPQSLLLFFFYSLGFLLPLIILSLMVASAGKLLKKFQKAARYSSIIAGILVIILGVLLFTNNLSILVNWLNLTYTNNNLSLL